MIKNFVAVILAAGKGTRIKARKINKVMFSLGGRPMISYTTRLLKKVGFKKIIVVVGFAKKSIIDYLGKSFVYVEQKNRLGTAHALKSALPKIPKNTKNVFVCYSDDTAFYPKKIITNLLRKHLEKKARFTLLTVVKQNPFGLGRILRNKQGLITGIIEEKDADEKQKKIKEINTGCYCFEKDFLEKYLPLIKKNPIKKEYYLTDIVGLAIADGQKAASLKVNKGEYFQGINTKQQLIKADIKMKQELKK